MLVYGVLDGDVTSGGREFSTCEWRLRARHHYVHHIDTITAEKNRCQLVVSTC